MDKRLFGTDGVRGQVGQAPMTPDVLVRLGYAIGKVLGANSGEVVIAKDTRLSGYMVESAIEAGLVASGMDTALTGPLPTAAVAALVAQEKAVAGVVISASHNPFEDNGIKIFDKDGNKLTDEQELAIERLALAAEDLPWARIPGKARRIDDATERFIGYCLASVAALSLDGLNIVVDAANGSTYACAPEVFRRLGASVYELACKPDGRNINANCGAVHPQTAADFVTTHNFDLGVSFDGDGDRLIVIDRSGRIVDGDAYLYVLATCLHAAGTPPAGIVGTLMSNQRLADELAALGIAFARSAVGDRQVFAKLKEKGWEVGGEPAGHLILLHKHSTGDGIIAALALLEALAGAKRSLEEVLAGYRPMPAATANVSCTEPAALARALATTIGAAEKDASVARVVVRPSGTEPALRILVEAATGEDARRVVAGLVEAAASEQ